MFNAYHNLLFSTMNTRSHHQMNGSVWLVVCSRLILSISIFTCLQISTIHGMQAIGFDKAGSSTIPNTTTSARINNSIVQVPTSVTGIKQPVDPTNSLTSLAVVQPTEATSKSTHVSVSTSSIPEDGLLHLDYSSINDEILRKKTANFVYYNANFNHCRNCQRFFGVWKELALDIKWWRQVIRLSTINCSDEDNVEMCRRAGVTQFPQVKYYWIQSSSLDRDGQRLRILGKSVHAMRHLIMDKVLESYNEHNKMVNELAKRRPAAGDIFGLGRTSLASLATGPTISPAFGMISNAIQTTSPSSSSNLLGNLLKPLLNSFSLGANHGQSGGASINSLLQQFMSSNNLESQTTNGAPRVGSSHSANNVVNHPQVGPEALQGLGQVMEALAGASLHSRIGGQPLPSNWPELDPIEVADSSQLMSMLPLDPSRGFGALLVMETPEFLYTGPELIFDLSCYSNTTFITRVRDDRSVLSKNITKRDDIQAPALIFITPTLESRLIITAPKYTNDEDLRRAFVRAFERRQVKYPVRRVWSSASTSTSKHSGDTIGDDSSVQQQGQQQVYMSDLINTIRSSVMEQVFIHTDLSDDQYNALTKYVYALINYFPFHDDESLKFFRRLHTWLQNQVSPMDVNEYKKQFHDIDESGLAKREWVGCKSLSNANIIPAKSRRPQTASLFENPAQIGKVVSNITKMLRTQQQEANRLNNLFNMFAPVMLTKVGSDKQGNGSTGSAQHNQESTMTPSVTRVESSLSQDTKLAPESTENKDESPIDRIMKSLTSGSLGTDSSILKLISGALTGVTGESAAGRSKFAREYPCGAWRLAHVMVINEYIKDSPRKDVKHIVLHSLYQYMVHFFACPTCGNRISDVSAEFRLNLDENLQDQADSVLLLWKVHNRVNKRLEGEIRPGSPAKVQFPTETTCPKCRAPRGQTDFNSTPNWHEKQVLNFLVHHYRSQNIVSVAATETTSSPNSASRPDGKLVGSVFMSLIQMIVSTRFALHRYFVS